MDVLDNGRTTILFIAGAGRSCTTLLGHILGQIKGFAFVGEAVHAWPEQRIPSADVLGHAVAAAATRATAALPIYPSSSRSAAWRAGGICRGAIFPRGSADWPPGTESTGRTASDSIG